MNRLWDLAIKYIGLGTKNFDLKILYSHCASFLWEEITLNYTMNGMPSTNSLIGKKGDDGSTSTAGAGRALPHHKSKL